MKQYKNTVQIVQNAVNTSTHITNPTHTLTHTSQNKLKQPQYKTQTKCNSHNASSTLSIKSLLCTWTFVPKNFTVTPLHFTSHESRQFTPLHYTSHHFTYLHSIPT